MKGKRVEKISSQDLDALITIFQDSSWREMRLSVGETTLILSKDAGAALDDRLVAPARAAAAVTETVRAATPSSPIPAPAAPGKPVADAPEGWVVVRAPSLGTFFRAPKPGSPPFCDAGQKIALQQELGLLEVMKLFTTVRSDAAGTLREILAKDGQMVEFDQPLFLIEPDA